MEPKFEDDKSSMHPRDIPFDLITQNILIRLPIKPIIRFKSVSKQWYSTISSPQFGIAHHKFHTPSPIESMLLRTDNQVRVLPYDKDEMSLVNMDVDFDIGDETLVLVGSSNGLVCFGSTSGCLFVIWNPITRKSRKYSDSEIVDFSPKEFTVTWGFGYAYNVEDFKVVRICKNVSEPSFAVHVFSIRFDKWRRIDNDTSHTTPNFYGLKIAEGLRAPGVLVYETLYWMGGVPPMLDEGSRKMISFDLALELFDTFPLLDLSSASKCNTTGECSGLFLLGVVKGSLLKDGRIVGSGEGLMTVLKDSEETEGIPMSRELIDFNCENLIEFRKNDVFLYTLSLPTIIAVMQIV